MSTRAMAHLRLFNTSLSSALPAASTASAAARSRAFHTTRPAEKNHAKNPRWLSEVNQRLKRYQEPEVKPLQYQKAKELSHQLQTNWLELLAGGEGYLTAKEWRGLDKHHVAWGDMDSMVRHVNNVMYNKYAESGRVNWLRNFALISQPEHQREWTDLMTPRSVGLILRSIKTDYKFPMEFPDRTTVLHKLAALPNYDSDHILLEAVILSEKHQRPAARCFEDIVVFDYRVGKKTPLKKFMVDKLRETYHKQEATRRRVGEEIDHLVRQVKEIESADK